MGTLTDLISCPDCGPVVTQEKGGVKITQLNPNLEVNQGNVQHLIDNGLEVECMNCNKMFKKTYSEDYLRNLASQP